jgi:S-DNA-T family DNA segregation ATPase FtsK/SpoIIIE
MMDEPIEGHALSDRRAWRLDLAAGVLLCAGLLVALTVFSEGPADLSGSTNMLGPPGARLAQALFQSLGVAVYVWLASWFVLVLLLFLRRAWLKWSLRFLGWLMLVPAVAVFAQRWGQPDAGPSSFGPGGALGAWLELWLEESASPLARSLLGGGAVLVAALLLLDLLLQRALRMLPVARAFGRRLGRALKAPFAVVGRGARRLLPRRRAAGEQGLEADSGPPGDGTFSAPVPIHHHEATGPLLLGGHEPHLAPAEAGLYSERSRFAGFELPPLTLLEDAKPIAVAEQEQQLRERAALLEKTFTDFGINVRVVGINTGPVITQYEVALETGLRLHKVTCLADDVALNLMVPSVRMVAPIPGKKTVGIEVPNDLRANVRLKEVMLTAGPKLAKMKVPLFLGKDAEGRPMVYDLADMPHLLIAGTTGTGKSVCLNAVITSMLMTRRPDEVKMVMIDPKNGVEMEQYARVPHLMHPVVGEMKKATAVLAWAVDKMEERYDLLRRARVRNIAGYNELSASEIVRRVAPADEEERKLIPERMPYIVIFVDEMSDLMLQMKKEVEGHIIRLSQKSRAAGIHLIVATQKPTVDVITGLIKSNLPARICFKVSQKSDSRVVLDEMGADKLLGKGDMLFLPPGTSTLVRGQGTFVSDDEVLRLTGHLECDPCYAAELMQLPVTDEEDRIEGTLQERLRARDKLYEQAVEVVVREGRGSVSLLQRVLGIGYGRAGRMIGWMEEDGIVGAYNGSNAREVLYSPVLWSAFRSGADS